MNRPYVRNGLNRYVTVGGVAFTYDGRGNLTSDGSRTFAYDLENRLTAATDGGSAMSLAYDPLGRLRQTTVGSATTQFLYDGDRLVAEYDAAGTLLRRYVHGAGVDEPVVWYEGSGLTDARHLMADERGSIVAASGASTTRHAYGPYGEPGDWPGPRFRYTGQIALPEVRLYHYKARAYVPGLGRFLQTDPVGYEDDLNLYGYVANDPINATDPTGMFTDVYIGGGGDQTYGKMVQSYVSRNPSTTGRTVGYFNWRQEREALAFIRTNAGNGEPINIIGHSYGADTAAVVANRYGGHIDTLVGVDPVSQPGLDVLGRSGSPSNVGTVVLVNASGPSITANEIIEGLGKMIGGGVPGAYRNPDVSISTRQDHANFEEIYTTEGGGDRSAKSIVDDTYRRPR